jgi:hypothetical protein
MDSFAMLPPHAPCPDDDPIRNLEAPQRELESQVAAPDANNRDRERSHKIKGCSLVFGITLSMFQVNVSLCYSGFSPPPTLRNDVYNLEMRPTPIPRFASSIATVLKNDHEATSEHT